MAYLFWHFIWHFFWHTSWHSFWNSIYLASIQTYFLAYLLTFFLAFYLIYLRKFFAVEVGGDHFDPAVTVRVRRGTLRWRACSWGSAGDTLILGFAVSGPAGDHCAHEFWVEVRWGTFLIPLASEVRRGTGRVRQGLLRSRSCSWGPVGNTFHPVLVVRARWGPVRSSVCSWYPAGNTLHLTLLFWSGRGHCDVVLATPFGRWRRKRRRRKRKTRATWHKIQESSFDKRGDKWNCCGSLRRLHFFCFSWKHCIAAVGNIE